MSERECSVCGHLTELACSNCRIDLATTVFVCANPKCRDAHEENCPSYLHAEIKRLRAAPKAVQGDRAFSPSGEDTKETSAFRRGAIAMREAAAKKIEADQYPCFGDARRTAAAIRALPLAPTPTEMK